METILVIRKGRPTDVAILRELGMTAVVESQDQTMHDISHPSPEPIATEDIPLPSNEGDQIPVSPALTSISSSTTPDKDILLNEFIVEALAVSPFPESLEAKRKQKAATFTSDSLDTFLHSPKLYQVCSQLQKSWRGLRYGDTLILVSNGPNITPNNG
jgi:hypothetical protein